MQSAMDMAPAELDDKRAELEAQLEKPITPANKRRIREQLNQVLNAQDQAVVSEPVSGMSDEELAGAHADLRNRLRHSLLTSEGRRELEGRLRDVQAVMDQRAEIAEMQARYQS